LTRAEVGDWAEIKEFDVACIEEQPIAVTTEILLRLAYTLDLPDFALLCRLLRRMFQMPPGRNGRPAPPLAGPPFRSSPLPPRHPVAQLTETQQPNGSHTLRLAHLVCDRTFL
jgi:hypothetical protein